MVFWLKALLVGGAFLLGGTIKHFWPSYPDDNPVEEFAEKIIKDQTGIDLDITPDSPESK